MGFSVGTGNEEFGNDGVSVGEFVSTGKPSTEASIKLSEMSSFVNGDSCA